MDKKQATNFSHYYVDLVGIKIKTQCNHSHDLGLLPSLQTKRHDNTIYPHLCYLLFKVGSFDTLLSIYKILNQYFTISLCINDNLFSYL